MSVFLESNSKILNGLAYRKKTKRMKTKENKHVGPHSNTYSSYTSTELGTTDFPKQRFSD